MKRNKEALITVVTFIGLGLYAFYSFQKTNPEKKTTESKTHKVFKKQKVHQHTTQKIPVKRAIASTSKKSMTNLIHNQRTYLGDNTDLNSIVYSNSISKDWKKKYRHNFLRMLPAHKVNNLKVELKKSIVLVKNNTGKYLEHVVVSYTNAEGRPFSFEAHINSQTGGLEQTWNKTHHEVRKPLQISGSKYAYKKEK